MGIFPSTGLLSRLLPDTDQGPDLESMMSMMSYHCPKTPGQASMDGNPSEGRLLGVSRSDIAVAIVDEAEKPKNAGRHWSPVSEWSDDKPMPSPITL